MAEILHQYDDANVLYDDVSVQYDGLSSSGGGDAVTAEYSGGGMLEELGLM